VSTFLETGLGPLCLIGHNSTLIWGMTNAERVRRLAEKAAKWGAVPKGKALFVNLAFAFDPILLKAALARPDVAIHRDGAFVIGLLPRDADPAAPDGSFSILEIKDGDKLYNEQLRKLEQPFVTRLTPETQRTVERQSYQGAYKGVTDALTLYLWPELALWLTRMAASLGMTPNMVTAIGGSACLAALWLFWQGLFWWGIAAAFTFMVLDTVDGKLARCTITSSKWGNVFDHGIDLVHPPFWWYAWGVGLVNYGRPLGNDMFAAVMAALIIGYVAQRLIEGVFIKQFGLEIHVWRRFDSRFRLITARRNPNIAILLLFLAIGRPDAGIIAVAIWTLFSLLVHAVRLAQAWTERRRGTLVSWLEAAA
jgi:phosphatidylglycerophosphate synthase